MKISKMANAIQVTSGKVINTVTGINFIANSLPVTGAQGAGLHCNGAMIGPTGLTVPTGSMGTREGSSPRMSLLNAEGLVEQRYSFTAQGAVVPQDHPINPLIVGLSFNDALWSGRPAMVRGENIDSNGPIHVGTFRFNEYVDVFHFHTWLTITERKHKDYFLISIPANVGSDQITRLCFNSQASLDAYTAWMAEYETRFAPGEVLLSPLPGLNDGDLTGHVLRLDGPETRWGTMVEYWSWIVQNISGKVCFCPGRIIFESAGDAIAFSLNFKGE